MCPCSKYIYLVYACKHQWWWQAIGRLAGVWSIKGSIFVWLEGERVDVFGTMSNCWPCYCHESGIFRLAHGIAHEHRFIFFCFSAYSVSPQWRFNSLHCLSNDTACYGICMVIFVSFVRGLGVRKMRIMVDEEIVAVFELLFFSPNFKLQNVHKETGCIQ